MQIFKILDKYLQDKEEGFNILFQNDKERVDSLIEDVLSFYYYATTPDMPYSLKYTKEELYNFLYNILINSQVDIQTRIICIQKLGLESDKELLTNFLEEIVNFPLTIILQNNINIDHINSYMNTIFNKEDKRVCEVIRKYFTNNTILRGNNTYNVLDRLLQKTYMFEAMDFVIYCYDIYYRENESSVNQIIRLLEDFNFMKCLTPELCIIAQQKVEGDEKLTNDLADYFINNLNFDQRRFIPFIRWGYQNLSVERRRQRLFRNIQSNDQNVHLLDSNRTTFLEWLNKRSEGFDEMKKTEEKFSKYSRLSQEIDNLTDEKIQKSLKTITENKTLLRIDENVSTIYCNDGIIEWKLVDIYNRIIFIIANHQYHSELKIRLIEELEDMSGTCFSGHFNRLTNVFAGIEEGIVMINKDKEIKKMIKIYLQNIIDEADEKIQDSILLKTDEDYSDETKEYIKREADIQLEIMIEENKEETSFPKLFRESVNEYFGSEIYKRLEF